MTDDIESLRQVAGAATPGPWHRGAHYIGAGGEAHDPEVTVGQASLLEDAAHIATFDPPTVLALLDRLEDAEEFAALWKRVAKKLAGDVREVELIDSGLRQAVVTIAFQRDAARAEVDALRSVIQVAGAALISASIPPGVTEVQFYRDLVGETFRILSRAIDTKEKPE